MTLLEVEDQMAQLIMDAFAKAAPDLGEVNDLAAEIARDSAGELIVGLNDQEVQRVRRLVGRAIDHGWNDAQIADRIRTFVGLDQRYQDAVDNMRQLMIGKGTPPAAANRAAREYAQRLREQRARTIARTEVMKALNTAQRELWAEAQEMGEISRYAVRVFRVHKDERLCKVCRPLNGRRAALIGGGYEALSGRVAGPPLHPNCRCTEELVDEGIIKSAPYKELWWDGITKHGNRGEPGYAEFYHPGPGGFNLAELKEAYNEYENRFGDEPRRQQALSRMRGIISERQSERAQLLEGRRTAARRPARRGSRPPGPPPRPEPTGWEATYLQMEERGTPVLAEEEGWRDVSGMDLEDDFTGDVEAFLDLAERARNTWMINQAGVQPPRQLDVIEQAVREADTEGFFDDDDSIGNMRLLQWAEAAEDAGDQNEFDRRYRFYVERRTRNSREREFENLRSGNISLTTYMLSIDPHHVAGIREDVRVQDRDFDYDTDDDDQEEYDYYSEIRGLVGQHDFRTGYFALTTDDETNAVIVHPDVEQRIRDTYEMQIGDYRMVVDRLAPDQYNDEGRIEVGGRVQKRASDGTWDDVGTWTVSPKGDGTVEHDYLQLTHDAQGAGLAAQWRYNLIPQYFDQGIEGVTVHANIDVGGYAWAKAGFTWNLAHGSPSDVVYRLENMIALWQRYEDDGDLERVPSQKVREDAQALYERMLGYPDENYPSPQDVARLGAEESYQRRKGDHPFADGYRRAGDDEVITSWAGKDVLLGSDWYAIAIIKR